MAPYKVTVDRKKLKFVKTKLKKMTDIHHLEVSVSGINCFDENDSIKFQVINSDMMSSFRTPRKLSRIAATKYVEDFVLSTQKILNLQGFKDTLTSIDPDHFCSDATTFAKELAAMKGMIEEIIKLTRIFFKKCKEEELEHIRYELRRTDHLCCCGTLVLQMMYDTEINFRRKHLVIFPLLLVMDRQFLTITKLIFDTREVYSTTVLCQLIKFLPNLIYFKGSINKEGKCLTALRKNCPKITEIVFFINDGCFTSNQLTSFFFSGKQMDAVKKAFVKIKSIELSFPKLKKFSINSVTYEQYDFFKMFLHFYPNVNFDAGLNYFTFHSYNVSWFDAVLSHTVMIHPNIRISQCDLNIYDLFLPFCEKSLNVWKNLTCLVITLGIQGKKNPGTSTNIGKKLESIYSKLPNVKDFTISVQGPMSDDEVTEIVCPTLKTYGKKLRQLKIIGVLHYLSHRSLVQAINLCHEVKELVLVGKRITKYFKDAKIIPLVHLESLTVVWSESQTNNAFCQWISRLSYDLIKSAPNLKKLFITANTALLELFCKNNFGAKLETLIVYFHTDRPADGVKYFKKFLPNLPSLKLIVVKESVSETRCTCNMTEEDDACVCDELVDAAYAGIKSIVETTEISVRYYSLEDAGTQIKL